MTRAELIAKLEAAEGASRELDAEIDILALESGGRQERYMTPDTTPHYTSSIDDALTLYREHPAFVSTDPRQVCIAALKARNET